METILLSFLLMFHHHKKPTQDSSLMMRDAYCKMVEKDLVSLDDQLVYTPEAMDRIEEVEDLLDALRTMKKPRDIIDQEWLINHRMDALDAEYRFDETQEWI